MKFGTKAIHAGYKGDPATGAIMPPIYQTSTYLQESPGKHKGYEYSRSHNPTRTVLEENIAALEDGRFGLCFASGMAAIDTIIRILKPGDEVISTNDLYGGSFRLFTKVFEPYGINFKFVSMENAHEIENHISEKTKMIWVETPTNPLLNIIDIEKIASIAKKKGILTTVDNTFATPFLQTPLHLGADIIVHSVTKYLGGHSDVIMGAVVVNDQDLNERLKFIQNSAGPVPGPQDCFLALRGIKTLHLRMKEHCKNARAVADYLEKHHKVDRVYYPGLKHHKNHEIASKQMKDFGGMVSFTLKGDNMEDAFAFLEKVKILSLAESLGGIESLCGHPASMTHASIPKETRLKAGLKDSLIRMSIGIEDEEDIIEDLKQAIG